MTDTILLTIAAIFAIVGFYVGCKLQWKYHRHFLSLKNVVEQSDFIYLKQKLLMCFGMGVIFAAVTGGVAFIVANVLLVLAKPISAPEAITAPSTPTMTPAATPPTPVEVAKPVPIREDHVPPNQQKEQITDEQPQPAAEPKPASSTAQALTKEEIERLEKEKQYSGNDPIVRERLGLPPKSQ